MCSFTSISFQWKRNTVGPTDKSGKITAGPIKTLRFQDWLSGIALSFDFVNFGYYNWFVSFRHRISLKLKWNSRSKLFYCTYHFSFFHAMMKFKDIDKKSHNLRNALMNENINIWNIRKRLTLDRTHKSYRISIWRQI